MKNSPKHKEKFNGQKLKIAIILPYFNEDIGLKLLEGSTEELKKHGVKSRNTEVIRTLGALEIPFACQKIIKRNKPDAIIALGVIIRGETYHFELVANETYRALMNLQLETDTPISFGILACENKEQAINRADPKGENRGKDATIAILNQIFL